MITDRNKQRIEEKSATNGQVVDHASDPASRNEPLETLSQSGEWNLEIIHMLVHDLKGPLSSIRVLSNLAQACIQEGNISEGVDFLTLIDGVEEDASRLIETLIRLLELNNIKFTLEPEPTNLSELLQNSIQRFSTKANEYAIALTAELPNRAVWIRADGQILKQVIDNLLSNAVKFTPAEGNITVRLSKQKDHVTLSVQDSGIGIPLEMQPELFEKFTKARRTGIHDEKTSGLGLSIVKKIVDIHRGSVYITSQEHRGSTFTIELPIE